MEQSQRISIPISATLAERLSEADERLGPDAVDVILDRMLASPPPEPGNTGLDKHPTGR